MTPEEPEQMKIGPGPCQWVPRLVARARNGNLQASSFGQARFKFTVAVTTVANSGALQLECPHDQPRLSAYHWFNDVAPSLEILFWSHST
jgi:hypothetical protein